MGRSNEKYKKNHQNGNKTQNTKRLKQQLKEAPTVGIVDGVFVYSQPLTIAEFAKKIGKNVTEILKYFFNKGLMMNQNMVLGEEQVGELALEYGFDFKKEAGLTKENIFDQLNEDEEDSDLLQSRPPVVTIMGHVDHGKTTLLDAIRNSNVVGREHGGITQAIGAYQIKTKSGKKITFIDTPGHEAFTEMRSRGANVTDIVILVVAADDGVMPQTEEAIDHAKQANVPIVVFVNKIDKPGANVQKIKSTLMDYGLVAEEFGGDIPFIEGSAKLKQGLDHLEETLLFLAELGNLKANPNKLASGTVIEAHLDKNKGPVAAVLVQRGTLNLRDIVITGSTFGTIKSMENENGRKLNHASPSQPLVITGLNEVPNAGDRFLVLNDEKVARQIANAQMLKKQEAERIAKQTLTLDTLKMHLEEGELQYINVLIKADSRGSVEALKSSLAKIDVNGVKINVIRASVGAISNSDVTLAGASKAFVYGFNVRPTAQVRQKALEDGVEIRLHNIIYQLIEELEKAAKGLLAPETEEVVLGQAEIRALFRHSDIGTIGGFHVLDGVISRKSLIRLLRNGIVVYNGEISSLKHGKEDIKEAKRDSEGGLTIKNFNDLKEGDIVEAYKIETKTVL